ncbi:tripartite tricarboxylate transporter substrate binding protein [Variovorax sp. J22P168]|uniref:Bug family tripartite tricarboxylate transporter substrate binding protein n=1 Tax=Variovorax jilinensis TaxID=3053513 RepID=UPI00257714DF|nr:tripartite tricarboxylate transporter substrate binding protein [Variovorax sp. J22P168]MDM0014881.1 tripartite tricarboxylate transporter substrate binding protein [Variovorax sp. J22P168]
MQTRLSTFLKALASAPLIFMACASPAQDFPTRAITMVVPFAPGGPTDTISRNIAQKMSDTLGQPVVVDNRPGGGGQIAGSFVRQAKPDGYTLFVGATEMFAINHTLFSKFSYDPMKDFTPVSAFVQTPMILVVAKDSAAGTVQDLIALAKSKPEGLSYASQGPGSIGHLLGQTFGSRTGVKMVHVPYKGSAPALQDLVTGRVDLMFDVMMSSGPLINAGKLKALAVADPRAFAGLPAVPTLSQAGVGGLDAGVWFGVVAPAGTPDAVVATLNAAVTKAIQSPDLVKRFADQGLDPLPMTAAQFGQFMKGEVNRWTPLVKASGAQVE